ncbi:Hypothetical predicted protein [Podarcis lilfordi]|uniref:Uncharacterized protein n=1 Tax=Podarcis lilfordi TaxID=74358 RepID=A0AA35PDR8_9SAUR|nr:Hypothetical predicted protein [Podarcis lilfordi]
MATTFLILPSPAPLSTATSSRPHPGREEMRHPRPFCWKRGEASPLLHEAGAATAFAGEGPGSEASGGLRIRRWAARRRPGAPRRVGRYWRDPDFLALPRGGDARLPPPHPWLGGSPATAPELPRVEQEEAGPARSGGEDRKTRREEEAKETASARTRPPWRVLWGPHQGHLLAEGAFFSRRRRAAWFIRAAVPFHSPAAGKQEPLSEFKDAFQPSAGSHTQGGCEQNR